MGEIYPLLHFLEFVILLRFSACWFASLPLSLSYYGSHTFRILSHYLLLYFK